MTATFASEPGASPRAATVASLTVMDVAAIVAIFLVSRAALLLVGYLAVHLVPVQFNGHPLLPDLLSRWDSRWYLDIAQGGYTRSESGNQTGASNFAFYPVYPMLIWALHQLTSLDFPVAGILVSNVSLLVALCLVFAYVLQQSGRRAEAMLCVVLICFVPQSIVFSAIYTEALFVALTAGSILAYSRQRYLTAALLSAINSAVRSNGVLIIVWYGLEILRRRGLRRAFRFWEAPEEYLPLVAAPLGLVAFWWFCYVATGDAFAQKSTILHGWGWVPTLPWNNIAAHLVNGTVADRFWVLAGLVALGLSTTLLRKEHWPLFGYCLANFALYFTGSLANSLLRYSISIVPIYFGLAFYLARSPVAAGIAIGTMALVGGFVMVAWTLGLSISI